VGEDPTGLPERAVPHQPVRIRAASLRRHSPVATQNPPVMATSKSPTLATGSGPPGAAENPPPWPPAATAVGAPIPPPVAPAYARSACEGHREWIEAQVRLGRNAMAIYQELVDTRGFTNAYNSVKRFCRGLRQREPEQFDRLEFLPGEESQVDYGEGALTLHPKSGKYRRPRLFIMMETEIWPNLLRICRNRGVKTVVINGRISSRSYPRYRMIRPFFRRVLADVDRFCMQSDESARRLVDLGGDPARVTVTGSLKFDSLDGPSPAATHLVHGKPRERVLRFFRFRW